MARFLDPTYDHRKQSGTSGAEVTDLNPEQAYDTDIRRLDKTEREIANETDVRNIRQQDRVAKYMAAAKTAGAYKQKTSIDEPQIRGRTPRNEANINGVVLPSQGDSGGKAGGVSYARKPQPYAGTFRGFS
jgi:hypothetical protein